ncbi:uncharacterized protein BX664DRAFT_325285 [Halteromyces radiatus]|uniref:uncharacterized protein n=1 Tax=Halteromyces radiatus TaxID=101107 RepID=UPI00221E5074|nr:uncharacterized protein BX664DRAFT_325285 [Halteromyces radiatus]KAI8096966.1 hypothetical protein BX664DRAFT_325285 [Halteromyces radiatus]
MTDKGTPQTIRAWLEEEFSTPGWHSAVVAQELSDDILDIVSMQFTNYDKATKIGILFSLLYIRKGELPSMIDNCNKIINTACQDQSDWVRLLGNILQGFATTKQLNLKCTEWSNQVQPLLHHIVSTVQDKGFGFHPKELMLMQSEAQPKVPFTNPNYESNEPTIARHFQLSTAKDDTISDAVRQNRFKALIQAEDDLIMAEASPLSSPTSFNTSYRFPNTNNNSMAVPGGQTRPPPSTALYARGSMDARAGLRPPPPRPRPATASSSSLFIQRPMVRKPSLGTDTNRPSFLRPSGPARFNRPLPPGMATNPTTSLTSMNASSRPSIHRQDNAIPKGFIKQSRVQMLDFNDASMLQESNTRAIDTAMQDLQNEKEARKHQLAEEKRQAAEKRKLEAQREKEEKEAAKKRKQSKTNPSTTVVTEGSNQDTTKSTSSSSPTIMTGTEATSGIVATDSSLSPSSSNLPVQQPISPSSPTKPSPSN